MESATLISHPAKQMTALQKKNVALQVINNKFSVSDIAKKHNVSRKFVHSQKDKAITALDKAFDETLTDDSQVLFYLPVTKAWIEQLVLCLMLYGRTSFRHIVHVIKDVLDVDLSVTHIHNISNKVKQRAKYINAKQDLSPVKLAAHDELFHYNKPVLVGVDIPSLYCYMLSQEDQRDHDTWAIHLMDIQRQGFNPDRVIGDEGTGLRAAHKTLLSDIPFDYDNFHLTKSLTETRRFFRNRYKTSLSWLITQECKMEKAKKKGNAVQHSRRLGLARKNENTLCELSQTIDTLVSWMQQDVLNKAGCEPKVRKILYDFIVDEFEKLSEIHPHRLKSLCTTLRDVRDIALAFCDVLDEKFNTIATDFECPIKVVWEMCELLRCDLCSDNYAIRSLPLQELLGDQYDEIEDAVIDALNSTERTSSMVENLNGRLRPYFFLRREIGHGYLDCLRFFLNHKPFDRSRSPHRKGKSPAMLLSGKSHLHWLEMLGYTQFKRTA